VPKVKSMPVGLTLDGPSLRVDRRRLMSESERAVPEAFDALGRLLAPGAGGWTRPSGWSLAISPIDGEAIAELPILDAAQAMAAVEAAAREFPAWASRPLAARTAAVARAVDSLREHRDLLVRTLAWEIGKTMPTASSDVDRCIAGTEWYLEEIGDMLDDRRPLGLVSNIASWNYPFSVLMLNVLVQALAGNAVVAKVPTQGGGVSLTLAFGLIRRAGLPVTLVGGRGRDLTEPLVGHPAVAGLAFVGGRANGSAVSRRLRGTGKRYALEMEGVNAYAVTDFTDWDALARQIRAGFDFGKQRCTAYTRWVVERSLAPRFVATYVEVVSSLRVGHPLLGIPVDFGPLISADKVEELRSRIADAKADGAEVLFEGDLSEDAFWPGQDRGAYLAPTLLIGVKAPSDLYLREPFGPVDVLVSVDSEDELVAEANVSGGALVASVATDDPARGERIAGRLQAFKVGVNRLRSRGDRDEPFGGAGRSWEGAFVGGANLVRAFTDGPQAVQGNWPT
jgi:acyl-CoA reductase-like NAD-dependent aldehyde dehydrogenase